MENQTRQQTFENLRIFQQAKELALAIYNITRSGPFLYDNGLRAQIQRASVSVISNIAEGFERGSNTEFIQFLYVSKGSCGEMRAQLILAHALKYIDQTRFQELETRCRTLSGMIAKFIAHLKNSSYRGAKFK